MKKNIIKNFKYGILVLGVLFSTNVYSENARIKIDIDRTIGQIDPLIYGNFVEHLGRCVYGGIYEPGSSQSDKDGFRKDVLEAAKGLNVSILRYPGGNFASNYHWLDGVGPKDERKTRMELAWARLETNQFGTNEFIKYVRKLGAEPYFTINMGTGTIGEAQSWIEYCNVKEGPYYAELRKKHGYIEPYGIKYWSLGNEMDGPWQIGQLNADDYSKKAREAAKIMKLTDPNIKLIAAGASYPGGDPDGWDRTVLYELRDVVDYISLHLYVGNPGNNYYNYLATPMLLEERTHVVKGMINEVTRKANRGSKSPIYIAWDEYNVWYRTITPDENLQETIVSNDLEERYNLEDALVIAGFLNAFIRNADIVKMANMAQLVNVIAPIFVEEDGIFLQTIYFPLQLFANNVFGTSLDVFVDCETYSTPEFFYFIESMGPTAKLDAVPYLDVSAAYNNGEVIICIVNRHKEKEISTDIISQTGTFSGSFRVYEINGPDIKAQNDFGKELIKIVEKPEVKAKGNQVNYSFPPHSFTMLKGKIFK